MTDYKKLINTSRGLELAGRSRTNALLVLEHEREAAARRLEEGEDRRDHLQLELDEIQGDIKFVRALIADLDRTIEARRNMPALWMDPAGHRAPDQ